MFALVAYRTGAVTVPFLNVVLIVQHKVNLHRIRFALGTLHMAIQQPPIARFINAQIQNFLDPVDFQRACIGHTIGNADQGSQVKPETTHRGKIFKNIAPF